MWPAVASCAMLRPPRLGSLFAVAQRQRQRLAAAVVAAFAVAVAACVAPDASAGEIVVSAASSVAAPAREIAAAFTQHSGTKVRLNLGSSGQLAQQIERGAPVDVFLSADRAYVEHLAEQGRIEATSVTAYATGRLVVWAPDASGLRFSALAGLRDLAVRRIAIANPAHAPYGAAAREALRAAGLWEVLEPKMITAESVQQAFQYAASGNVQAALVPESFGLAGGRTMLVPPWLYRPVVHTLGIVSSTTQPRGAREFAAFMAGTEAGEILERHGFAAPGEEP